MKRQTVRTRARAHLIAVDNPEFSTDRPIDESNPRTVQAVVSLRESSIISLAAHGVLDADQVASAWRFRRAWELVQAMRVTSAGFSEWIDAGCRPTAYAERQLMAATELRLCRRLLGTHGYALVSRVCGDGFHIRDLYRSRRERDTATDMLRVHLNELSALWR